MADNNLLPMLILGNEKSWEMPQLPGLNKLPPHATLYPFPDPQSALTLEREQSPFFQPLNGSWDFKILSRPEEATRETVSTGEWSKINVPGN